MWVGRGGETMRLATPICCHRTPYNDKQDVMFYDPTEMRERG